MAIRTIRKEGDEILSKKSKPIKEINDTVIQLIDDMLETMRSQDGVGIAAPQVGALKRVVVIEFEEDLYELINPEIIEAEGDQVCNEACLSAPGRCGDIERPFKIVVQAMNRQGEIVTHEIDDFMASVFCHEIDHLDGIMFLDKAKNIRLITEAQMRKRKQERKERRRKRLAAKGK